MIVLPLQVGGEGGEEQIGFLFVLKVLLVNGIVGEVGAKIPQSIQTVLLRANPYGSLLEHVGHDGLHLSH